MNKPLLAALLFAHLAYAQNTIEWDGIYQLQLSDFQAEGTQIGDVDMYSLHTQSGPDFAFQMSGYEFMFTKNFNEKVSCAFRRDMALLLAPDTAMALELLRFAQYDFDLSELYARKLRKRLYEEKGAFSDFNFFQPTYDALMKEFQQRHSQTAKESSLGSDGEKLQVLHEDVRREIAELADFCKTCKPPKRKKQKETE